MPNLFEDDQTFEMVEEPRLISGYRIYAPLQKARTVVNDLPEFYPELPEGPFDIFISAANFKYPTIKTKELKKIPIQQICADDCLLFMWVTNPHLAQGIELGQAWGFEYKTVGFVWDKCNHNPGQYTLSNCELCLIFKKGRIPQPRGARNVQQLVRIPRTEHSVKPIEVLHNIERMFPTQRKIELFARHKPAGWTVWGLDVRPVYGNRTSQDGGQ